MMESASQSIGFVHMPGFGYMFIVPLLIIALLFWAFSRDRDSHETQSAQDILDKRYANGGINKEEYEEKSQHISNTKKR